MQFRVIDCSTDTIPVRKLQLLVPEAAASPSNHSDAPMSFHTTYTTLPKDEISSQSPGLLSSYDSDEYLEDDKDSISSSSFGSEEDSEKDEQSIQPPTLSLSCDSAGASHDDDPNTSGKLLTLKISKLDVDL
jgi:hypothetical protein